MLGKIKFSLKRKFLNEKLNIRVCEAKQRSFIVPKDMILCVAA